MREPPGFTKPAGVMKVKGVAGRTRQDPLALGQGAHRRPVSAATSARRSQSVHVGTRKMVNYA